LAPVLTLYLVYLLPVRYYFTKFPSEISFSDFQHLRLYLNFPLPSKPPAEQRQKPFTRHIVAVGDLHGDYPNALRVLHFSGVIDGFGDWSGDVDFFVQTGDIIDR
jgi:hypothetical protein